MNTESVEKRTVMCRYQGPATGEKVRCNSCAGNVRQKKFACQNENRKGEVVTFLDCQRCAHYAVAGLPLAVEKPADDRKLVETTPNAPSEAVGNPPTAPDKLHAMLKPTGKQKLVLINRRAPGDCLVMTAAIESLAHCYPGRFELHLLTTCPEVYENNPHVASNRPLRSDQENVYGDDHKAIVVESPVLVESNARPIHVLESDIDSLKSRKAALDIPNLFLTTNRPHLYFSEEEQEAEPLVYAKPYWGRKCRYWLLNAGCKADIRTKLWGGYADVVKALRGRVMFVQVGARGDYHQPIEGTLNMVGCTDLRQLINMVRHADGVLTGISFLMHAAASLVKPCVVLAGGIEPKTWNAYAEQKYLSTVGQMDCCQHGGCWRSTVTNPKDCPVPPEQNLGLCKRPLPTVPATAACMGSIAAEEVVREIEKYYLGGAVKAGM